MNQANDVQKALQDLAVVRRAVEGRGSHALPTQALILTLGFVLSSAVALYEIASEQNLAAMLALSRIDPEIGTLGLGIVALCLPFLLAAIYFAVWRGARHSDRDVGDFVNRNFQYLKNFGFCSDLFVKFVVLALAVLPGHADWVPSLLLLFLGDYLLQGRYFTMPLALALVLGPVCFAGAGLLYAASSTQLLYPLLAFAALSAISLATLALRRAEKRE